MADHSLKSATDRCLGKPLPHQLANQTRVHPVPPEFFTLHHAMLCAYAVLAVVSNCYPPVWGRLPTRYSPVRHSVTKSSFRRNQIKCFVRLACVKHAASVHPEPGSNSRLKFLIHFRMTLAILPSITVVLEFIISDDVHWKSFIHFQGWLLFNYQCSCFACCCFSSNSFILSRLFCFVNNFFMFFNFFFVIQNLESIKFFCLNCCLNSQLE